MKKLLLGLGTLAAVAAPVATVIACGGTKEESTEQTKITQIATDTRVNQTKITEHASVIQPEDEGFDEGSLIENFDINNESQSEAEVVTYYYNGKTYDSESDVFAVWAKDAQEFVGLKSSLDCLKGLGVMTTGAKLSFDGNTYHFMYIDGDKQSAQDREINGDHSDSDIIEFRKKVETQMSYINPSGSMGQNMESFKAKHHLSRDTRKTLSPLKHSIDSIIYSEAQSLTNIVDANQDKVVINSTSKELGIVEMPVNGFNDFQSITEKTSFSTGDSLTFVFNNERDIKSFTQRVGYIDGVNNMFTSTTAKNKVMKLGVLDGGIYSYEPKEDAPDKTKAAFKLEAIAKNAVKLTFIKPTGNAGNDQGTKQFFLLNGFNDLNGDGVITAEDKGITNPFDYK